MFLISEAFRDENKLVPLRSAWMCLRNLPAKKQNLCSICSARVDETFN